MKKSSVGKIISISDLNIKILLNSDGVEIKDILYYEDDNKKAKNFNKIGDLDRYLKENCAYECKYFVAKRNNMWYNFFKVNEVLKWMIR